LVLWDVDGTLVRAGELGATVFDAALEGVLGVRPDFRVRMSGKTDPQIVGEYLEVMGVEASDAVVDAILRDIEGRLAAAAAAGELTAGGSACPGAAEILSELAGDPRVVSTLLTGNVYLNAVVKVAAFGLHDWLDLDVGAYGSDEADRRRLVPVAMSRVEQSHGARIEPDDAWVVGDTPRDLECARAAGARCLLVATGRYRAEQLEPLGADAVLEDLSDTKGVLELLTGDL
jgi:phosphoglycolate phosphatase